MQAEALANTERFRSEAGLAKLAANWPAARLVDIWNSLPGSTPVKKFTDRKTAVNRIWKAIQSLGNTAEVETTQEPDVALVKSESHQEAEVVQATPEVQAEAEAVAKEADLEP